MKVQRPQWYRNPEAVVIHIDRDRVVRSPLGNEVSIALDIEGEACTVVVPADALDDDECIVHATKVGEVGNFVLLSFPPTSLGTSTCLVLKSRLGSLVKERS